VFVISATDIAYFCSNFTGQISALHLTLNDAVTIGQGVTANG